MTQIFIFLLACSQNERFFCVELLLMVYFFLAISTSRVEVRERDEKSNFPSINYIANGTTASSFLCIEVKTNKCHSSFRTFYFWVRFQLIFFLHKSSDDLKLICTEITLQHLFAMIERESCKSWEIKWHGKLNRREIASSFWVNY